MSETPTNGAINSNLNDQAENTKQQIVARMKEAADRIRQELDGNELDAETRQEADEMINRFENVTDYFDSHSIPEIQEDANEAVRDNAWQLILVALILGVIIGALLRGGKQNN